MPDERDVIPLSRFSALLARPRGARRVEAILATPDPAATVASLPLQELHFLVQEVGLADARELVELATPEQVQGLLDLSAWDRDQIDPADVKPWLEVLVDAGAEKLTEVVRGLDPELAALLLARWTRIYDLVEEHVPETETPPFYATPDTFFMVKITAEDPEVVRLVERTLDALYRTDAELARHILRSALSEVPAYLEEMSYRWRTNRMQELGYADYYEALEVYRPLDVESVRVGEATAQLAAAPAAGLPVQLAERAVRHGFLGQVLGRVVDPEEARRLEAALVVLLNRVLSADRVDPGDVEAAAAGAARAAATVSLGLEAVAHGDPEVGLTALRTIALVRLHRLGHTIALKLAQAAALLGPLATRADEPHRSVVAALAGRRPGLARALDTPPAAGERPFANLAEVGRVAAMLAELGLQVQAVRWIAPDPSTLGPEDTLGDIGRTAVARAALGQAGRFRGLVLEEVVELVRTALAGGRFTPEAEARVEAAFPREYAALARGWMGDLGRRLGAVDLSKPLDRRLLEGLVFE